MLKSWLESAGFAVVRAICDPLLAVPATYNARHSGRLSDINLQGY